MQRILHNETAYQVETPPALEGLGDVGAARARGRWRARRTRDDPGHAVALGTDGALPVRDATCVESSRPVRPSRPFSCSASRSDAGECRRSSRPRICKTAVRRWWSRSGLPAFSSGVGAWSMFEREEAIWPAARPSIHPEILPLAEDKRRSYLVTEYVPVAPWPIGSATKGFFAGIARHCLLPAKFAQRLTTFTSAGLCTTTSTQPT